MSNKRNYPLWKRRELSRLEAERRGWENDASTPNPLPPNFPQQFLCVRNNYCDFYQIAQDDSVFGYVIWELSIYYFDLANQFCVNLGWPYVAADSNGNGIEIRDPREIATESYESGGSFLPGYANADERAPQPEPSEPFKVSIGYWEYDAEGNGRFVEPEELAELQEKLEAYYDVTCYVNVPRLYMSTIRKAAAAWAARFGYEVDEKNVFAVDGVRCAPLWVDSPLDERLFRRMAWNLTKYNRLRATDFGLIPTRKPAPPKPFVVSKIIYPENLAEQIDAITPGTGEKWVQNLEEMNAALEAQNQNQSQNKDAAER